MLRQIPLPLLSLLIAISTPTLPLATARSLPNNTTTSPSSTSTATPSNTTVLNIVDGSDSNYTYIGCWNETFGLPGTNGMRALDGVDQVLPGDMTVERCLDFCARNTPTHPFRLAGLEFSRECWCGDTLNALSVLLPDDACDTPCDGANTTACGGALRLTLYNSTAIFRRQESSAGNRRGEGAWRGAVLGTVVWGLGVALGV
ncbi:WSC domain-containing protein [Ustulina deusta]|nr:WSC domain-containing protein [Ustulina deusta]KAI3342959.1 WSC domain-containing protein [Ustulina deusta]